MKKKMMMKLSDIEKMKKTLIPAALAILLSMSCTKKEVLFPTVSDGDFLKKEINWKVDEYDGETKGVPDSVQDKISDANIIVFDARGKLVGNCGGYMKSISHLVFPEKGEYSIYVIANAGNLSGIYPEDEEDMEDFSFDMPSAASISGTGLPMSGYNCFNTESSGFLDLNLTRLVTKLYVKFNKEDMKPEYRKNTCVTSLGIRQEAVDIYPFALGGSTATKATAEKEWGDKATEEEIAVINDGGMVTFYVPTNMQGDLLEEDIDQADKVPGMLEMEYDVDFYIFGPLLTYLEMHCRVEDDAAVYQDVVFRHYIGGSAATGPDNYNCSFNIYPNRTREMTLVLSGDDVIKQSWRLEPYSPQWKECVLQLTPLQNPMLVAPPDPDRPSTTGVRTFLRVLHHRNVGYNISVPGNSHLEFSKTWVSPTEDRVEFYTKYLDESAYIPPCIEGDAMPEDLEKGLTNAKVAFTTTDGSLSKSIDVCCMHCFLGCYYTLDADAVTVSVFNKFALTFRCSLTAAVKTQYGVTSDIGMGSNPHIFTAKPSFGREDMFEEDCDCSGYYARGPRIWPLYDVSGEPVGSRATLTVSCEEFPGLTIKYGEGPLMYYSKTGSGPVKNLKLLRMSRPDSPGQKFYTGRTSIGLNRLMPDYLIQNYMQYFVNGEPDVVYK